MMYNRRMEGYGENNANLGRLRDCNVAWSALVKSRVGVVILFRKLESY